MFRATHRSSSGAQKLIAASAFTYVAIAAAGNQTTHVKPEAAITVFELLIMSGVSLKTC
jgi:hypothetical protein